MTVELIIINGTQQVKPCPICWDRIFTATLASTNQVLRLDDLNPTLRPTHWYEHRRTRSSPLQVVTFSDTANHYTHCQPGMQR